MKTSHALLLAVAFAVVVSLWAQPAALAKSVGVRPPSTGSGATATLSSWTPPAGGDPGGPGPGSSLDGDPDDILGGNNVRGPTVRATAAMLPPPSRIIRLMGFLYERGFTLLLVR
jgi:hypothetical protein